MGLFLFENAPNVFEKKNKEKRHVTYRDFPLFNHWRGD
jgi:hypothetical protein